MIPLDAVDWIEIGVAAIAGLSALVAIDAIVETVCVGLWWRRYLMALRRPELISVIVTTYNWPEALTAVLRGLRDQEDRNFQVVVAEDGFDHRTRDVISQTHSHGLQVKHVRHEDQGFRLAEIRNRAMLASEGEYLIFLDGDCIPRPSFVAAHRRIAEPGHFVVGNRVLLREKMTQRVLSENLAPEYRGVPYWFLMRWLRRCNRVAPMITLPLGPLRRNVKQSWQRAMGCNVGAWRADVERVNGVDSSLCGWGSRGQSSSLPPPQNSISSVVRRSA